MQDGGLGHYKQMLLEMRSRLREEIGHSIETVREEVQVPGEDTKEPSEGLEKELALEQTQEELRGQVNAALERIELGTFGRCVDCGAEITGERLAAVPYTAYCVACERTHEAS